LWRQRPRRSRRSASRPACSPAFHSHLLVFLQQITPYTDTKDRSVLGHLALVDEQAINAVADELLRRSEMMQVRDSRFAAQVRSLDAAHQEMRSSFATLYQATFTLKRELERLTAPSVVNGSGTTGAPSRDAASPGVAATSPAKAGAVPGAAGALDSWKYVGFEDQFRGAPDEIRRRQSDYVREFAGSSDVLDAGCGRGEFLDLLREAGVPARGLERLTARSVVNRSGATGAASGDAASPGRAGHVAGRSRRGPRVGPRARQLEVRRFRRSVPRRPRGIPAPAVRLRPRVRGIVRRARRRL